MSSGGRARSRHEVGVILPQTDERDFRSERVIVIGGDHGAGDDTGQLEGIGTPSGDFTRRKDDDVIGSESRRCSFWKTEALDGTTGRSDSSHKKA